MKEVNSPDDNRLICLIRNVVKSVEMQLLDLFKIRMKHLKKSSL